jgi:hypothetical protein
MILRLVPEGSDSRVFRCAAGTPQEESPAVAWNQSGVPSVGCHNATRALRAPPGTAMRSRVAFATKLHDGPAEY